MFSRATTTRTTIAAATLAAAGALVAGCSSLSGGGNAGDPSLSTSDSATAPATSSATAPSSTGDSPTPSTGTGGGNGANANGGKCETANLKASAGHGNSAAGNHYVPLTFTNTGSHPCTMRGWPGVSYTNGPKGSPVGKPAHRTGSGGSAVTLAPGGSAVAKIDETQVRNYDPDACGLTEVKGLRVYPPENTTSLFVTLSNAHACSGTGISGEQLQVKPVTSS